MKKHVFHFMLLNIAGASLMLTLNDERRERDQNILFCGENRVNEESFCLR
jgi:hypothetical protein